MEKQIEIDDMMGHVTGERTELALEVETLTTHTLSFSVPNTVIAEGINDVEVTNGTIVILTDAGHRHSFQGTQMGDVAPFNQSGAYIYDIEKEEYIFEI